ncbi:MAG TPA: SOS response-associated peptidase family protein [Verrucomicrobiae bacterium]|nr:SOS response-associated peptidase family protein [Verrucomicrobiae bacterium]
MCSNYKAKKNEARIKARDQELVFGFVPRENIRPTDYGPVVLPEEDSLVCREMRWGWTVPWDKNPLVNAKSETVIKLATFREHINNRCLLLADGFYEKGVLFRQPGHGLFCLAGLWRMETEGPRYVMLTTTPNKSVAPYHHRMPLIVRPELYDAWLGNGWQRVLAEPDHALLDKFQKQPELF